MSGTLSALVVGFGELAVSSTAAKGIWPVVIGLYLPLGLFIGLGLCACHAMLGLGPKDAKHPGLLSVHETPEYSCRILSIGLVSLVALPLYFKTGYHFMTAYRHPELATFSLLAALFVLSAFVLLISTSLTGLLTSAVYRLPFGRTAGRRPVIAAIIVTISWLGVITSQLLVGDHGKGPYAFIGLLLLDGLGLGRLILFAFLSVLSTLAFLLLKKKIKPWGYFLAMGLLAASVSGLYAANSVIEKRPEILDTIDSEGYLSATLLKLGRRFTDRDGDGHGIWLGGKDCDDSNPDINPSARDVPDNGVDEDCSGEDLSVAKLQAELGALSDSTPQKPEKSGSWLPDDTSLILITIDSLRFDEPGFMGRPRDVTPNLDRLASTGTIYDRAYGLGSYTGHAIPSILTGKYASELTRNDKQEIRIGAEETFAAELICGTTVRCAAFLSHFLFKPYHGWHQGFGEWTIVPADPPGPGHVTTKYSAHNVALSAITWLSDPKNTQGRFWLWLHFMDPHREYLSHPGVPQFGDEPRDQYDHEVLFTDRQVGRVLDHLKTMDIAKRTIVLVTSDHGESFLEHGRYHHGRELWEEIIRVPMVVAGAGIQARHISRPTSHIDLYPTLLDIFGVPVSNGQRGRSLAAEWFGDIILGECPIIADQPATSLYETRRVFIQSGWKLHHLPDIGSYRLFRLDGAWETGESLDKTEVEKFSQMRTAYELFLATGMKPVKAKIL